MVTVPGYRIEELLSWGSQGDVFRGIDAAGATVAMKVVTSDRTDGDPQAMDRLRREARLLAEVDSPHVVKVREFVQTMDWSCLVLEFLAGQRLDAVVRQRAGGAPEPTVAPDEKTRVLDTPVPAAGRASKTPRAPAPLQNGEHVAWALGIALQLARGLAAMHASGLIHRDVKPQNAMLVGERVVLIDFGFARRDGVTTMTQNLTAIGTLAYMAPELLNGATADPRSDVHALGASLFQCLVGAPPFPADAKVIAAMAARRRPPDVRRSNCAVGAALAAVVARCLEPDPRDRYTDAGAVLADLERVQRGEVPRQPFSSGRWWRHHGRGVMRAAMLASALLLIAWWITGFDPNGVAARIQRATNANDASAAITEWKTYDDDQRAQVAVALGRRVGADSALAAKIAEKLGLALLTVQPRPNHRIALLPAREAEPPPIPADAFMATDTTCSLLVRPGRAWCFVMSSERQYWWSQDDPLCLQFLLDLAPSDGQVVARSIATLPTQSGRLLDHSPVRFEAGSHSIRDNDARCVTVAMQAPFAVDATEVSAGTLGFFRMLMRGLDRHDEVDFWLRHPEEPHEITKALWERWTSSAAGARDVRPAATDFWEAHRCATWFACRLPALVEWQVAACEPKHVLGTNKDRAVPGRASMLAVDAAPTWDVTGRGVRFANSNEREWILGRRTPETRFLALPEPLLYPPPDGLVYSGRIHVDGGEPPLEPHGFRLCRELLLVPPR